tara:strand:- start:86 stop:415 length:330 start_codon:yes stop_codon:yes gene_type:complete
MVARVSIQVVSPLSTNSSIATFVVNMIQQQQSPNATWETQSMLGLRAGVLSSDAVLEMCHETARHEVMEGVSRWIERVLLTCVLLSVAFGYACLLSERQDRSRNMIILY